MTLCVPERNGKYSIEKTFVYCGYDTAYSRMCIFLVYGNRAAGYAVSGSCYKDPSVSGFFRFLAKIGDGMMKMQIVKIGFGGKQ